MERFTRGYHLYALFNNVQELKIGDRVKVAGVEVGRVEDIQLNQNENKVRVVMKVRRNAGIRTASLATVKFAGLLGQNFVALNFGSPGAPLAVNDTILATIEQPDLSALMAKLDSVATGVENLTLMGSVLSGGGNALDNFIRGNAAINVIYGAAGNDTLVGFAGLYFVIGVLFLFMVGREIAHGPQSASASGTLEASHG